MKTILERCTQDLERAQAELKAADEKFCEFRREHCAVIDGRFVIVGSEVTSGQKLGREYFRLFKQLDLARSEVQGKMVIWARAKGEHDEQLRIG